ncbi:hypothetical protein EVAR_97104_1 [Eumeta japonica]|uniref:Uncharacterized protein n=1 Tax=Eumeta variegata TaxID=151549 RepID=A0A4C1X4Q1_EUMVA|nr:hypothetical protein EVAR_97104_1 [Eumeta japonica]
MVKVDEQKNSFHAVGDAGENHHGLAGAHSFPKRLLSDSILGRRRRFAVWFITGVCKRKGGSAVANNINDDRPQRNNATTESRNIVIGYSVKKILPRSR